MNKDDKKSYYNSQEAILLLDDFKRALDLLDDYDHGRIEKKGESKEINVITYDECLCLIGDMRFSGKTDLFGSEKDCSYNSAINAVYQTVEGQPAYKSVEEKAANLLYFCIKNHSFYDGNKRIAAATFLYFLLKNDALYLNGVKRISDDALVALTVLIAQSKPEEKEMMVNLTMNLLK